MNGDIKDHEDTSVDIMETPDTSEHHRPHSVIIIGGKHQHFAETLHCIVRVKKENVHDSEDGG